jgi:hypothetical protein
VRRFVLASLAALLLSAEPGAPVRTELDRFVDVSGWTPHPSEGVHLALSSEKGENPATRSLRLDFDFSGRAGWAAVRKAFSRPLPPNWALELRLKGDAPSETLEVKLLDDSGQNVWWSVRRDFTFPRTWTTLRIRKRQISFAWGPAGGGSIERLGFLEIAITAGAGGRGTVWIDGLVLEELPLDSAPPAPLLRASSSVPGSGPDRALDGDPGTGWRSAPGPDAQDLVLDLGGTREFGGLTLDWDAQDFPSRYMIELSPDAHAWRRRREVAAIRGGRADLYLPDAESRFVRIALRTSSRGRGYALSEISVRPPEFSETPTAFLTNVARDSPKGLWPRSLAGQQLYWTVVGVARGRQKALLSEDGALELSRGGCSIEPFLWTNGRLLGWSEADISHSLARGDLPIPTVTRRYPGGLELEVTALADGPPDAADLRGRYRIRNGSSETIAGKLFLAIRPLQVNPPWQFLNVPGGFSPIREITERAGVATVTGSATVIAMPTPSGFGASSFDGGEISRWIARGELPPSRAAADPDGFASGAFAWDVTVPPGGLQDVFVASSLGRPGEVPSLDARDTPADFERRLAVTAKAWKASLDNVSLELPPGAPPLGGVLASSLAWILLDADGPALQPGSRAYDRSWIRDGAMISAALLRLGHPAEVRDYLRWYAPFEFPGGRVPCCVDRRGADPVPENDSQGELLWLAAEYQRFTRDVATIRELWPLLSRAAAYIDELRRQRRTPEYRSGDRVLFFGLLPESISHEGYSAKPVHSYWDDFWAVEGLSGAAELAAAIGREEEAGRLRSSRDELRADLHASIRRVIAARRIDFVPGSADLADFDATSTTVALSPGREASRLPQPELRRTFQRYWEGFLARRAGTDGQEAYTPYEWRIVGALVRLGWRDRARELLDSLLDDRRVLAWNEWPEVVWRNPRLPRFLGDLPHGWVAADFIRSTLDLFAYDRPEDRSLVLAGGVAPQWLEGRGVVLRGLGTAHGGTLDLSLRETPRGVVFSVSGALTVPAGGIVLRPPLRFRPARVLLDGKPVPFSGEELVLRRLPAETIFER